MKYGFDELTLKVSLEGLELSALVVTVVIVEEMLWYACSDTISNKLERKGWGRTCVMFIPYSNPKILWSTINEKVD